MRCSPSPRTTPPRSIACSSPSSHCPLRTSCVGTSLATPTARERGAGPPTDHHGLVGIPGDAAPGVAVAVEGARLNSFRLTLLRRCQRPLDSVSPALPVFCGTAALRDRPDQRQHLRGVVFASGGSALLAPYPGVWTLSPVPRGSRTKLASWPALSSLLMAICSHFRIKPRTWGVRR